MNKGKLYLLPNLLSLEADPDFFFPPKLKDVVASLDGLFSENEKNGRVYLKMLAGADIMRSMPQKAVNEHIEPVQLKQYANMLQKGGKWGLVTDCGLPCFADPGAQLVALVRNLGVEVIAFSGPSSITMALMLSGFSAQAFVFHGYLPKDEPSLKQKLRQMEKEASRYTQIWIETPYRTDKMLSFLIKELSDATNLCVAADLTGPMQQVVCKSVALWKKQPVLFGKLPAIFLIQ